MNTEKNLNQVAEYNPLIAEMHKLQEQYKGLVYDVTIPEQYDNAETERKAFVKLNNQIDKVRSQIKKAPLELCKQIDAQAKAIIEPLDKRIKELKTLIDAENERQAIIDAELNKRIADIRATPMLMVGRSSDDMKEAHNAIMELKTSEFGGYDIAAQNAINEALAQLEPMIAAQANAEQLARKQAEQQAILDARQAELDKVEREQQAKAAEAQRLADLEQARLDGIAQAQRDAQAAVERAEHERIAAENEREQQARAAAEAKYQAEALRPDQQKVIDWLNAAVQSSPSVNDGKLAAMVDAIIRNFNQKINQLSSDIAA